MFLYEDANVSSSDNAVIISQYGETPSRLKIILQGSRSQVRYDDEDEDEGPQPDPMFEQGAPIPVRLHNEFPPELASTPLEDIDSFYHNQRVPALTH